MWLKYKSHYKMAKTKIVFITQRKDSIISNVHAIESHSLDFMGMSSLPSVFALGSFGEFDFRRVYTIKVIPMTVATTRTMEIPIAIRAHCHVRRLGSFPWGGNGVGTESTV